MFWSPGISRGAGYPADEKSWGRRYIEVFATMTTWFSPGAVAGTFRS